MIHHLTFKENEIQFFPPTTAKKVGDKSKRICQNMLTLRKKN